jgi:hypothetical protein
MFHLSSDGLENWRSQIVTSDPRVKMRLRRSPNAFTGVRHQDGGLDPSRQPRIQMSTLI